MKFYRQTKFSHITQREDFVKIKFHDNHGYMPRFLNLCKYQHNPVILMHNTKLIHSDLFYLCIFWVIGVSPHSMYIDTPYGCTYGYFVVSPCD